MPKVSVIISTYNQPQWLVKVLTGYEVQQCHEFEIIIADDGSNSATKNAITSYQKQSKLSIQHLWQPDDGFQKNKILNTAILQAKANYLLFTDGDCIPRNDFLSTHLKLRKPNCFLSGGYFKLPQNTSKIISKQHIVSQLCFQKKWLLQNGVKQSFKLNKLTASGFKEWALNTFTPTKATWDGMNVSGWKSDILAVNGYDERMQYGGEDRELGERLINYGIKPIQIRYSAICLHLYHKRAYKNKLALEKNLKIRKGTKQNKRTWTAYGIIK